MQNRKANQTGNRRKKYTEEQITQILKEAEVSNNVSDSYTVAAVRACGLIGISRSAFAYRKKSRSEALRERIKELAGEHYRWGYRLLFNYLRRLGENVNHKKFLRIYRQEHLQIGKRSRRKERRFDRVKSGHPPPPPWGRYEPI